VSLKQEQISANVVRKINIFSRIKYIFFTSLEAIFLV